MATQQIFLMTLTLLLFSRNAYAAVITREDQVQDDSNLPGNLELPEHVRALFQNLSKESGRPNSDSRYNTIRFFENITNIDGCLNNTYTMKFNLSSIKVSELIHKADLRVYLAVKAPSQRTIKVSLQFLGDTYSDYQLPPLEVKLDKSSWLEFNVGHQIYSWLGSKTSPIQVIEITFTDELYPSCNGDYVIDTEKTNDRRPLLTVYSFETDGSSFLHLVEKAMEEPNNSERDDSFPAGPVKKRETSTSLCDKVNLEIDIKWLNEHVFEGKMIAPEKIAINTCQGKCSPVVHKSKHSTLLQILKNNHYQKFDYSSFFSSCVPISYRTVIVALYIDKSYVLEKMDNISVDKCGCNYVHMQ